MQNRRGITCWAVYYAIYLLCGGVAERPARREIDRPPRDSIMNDTGNASGSRLEKPEQPSGPKLAKRSFRTARPGDRSVPEVPSRANARIQHDCALADSCENHSQTGLAADE